MLEGHVLSGPVPHDDDLEALEIEAEMTESRQAGGARPQGGYGEAGEIQDRIGSLEGRDGAGIEVVSEVEHHVSEVRPDDLESGLDAFGGKLASLDAGRSGKHQEAAGVLDEKAVEQGLVEPLDVLERVEHRVRLAEVEEGGDVGLARVEVDQDGAAGRALG